MSSSPPLRKKSTLRSKQPRQKQYPILNLYILVTALFQILGQIFNIYVLHLLKPVPMVLMIIYISGKNSQRDHLVPTLIRSGLVVSLVGDLLLMVPQISAFMIGTFFFLIAHILYCIAFSIGTQVRVSRWQMRMVRYGVCLVLLGMCAGNIYQLWDLMPNRVLFSVYAFVLCLMNIFAVKRYEITTTYSYKFILIGAILFGLSDNLLAFLKFNHISTDFGRGMVMLFYYGGQYLLMHGAIHHSNLQHQIMKFLKGTNGVAQISVGTKGKKGKARQWDHGEGQDLPLSAGAGANQDEKLKNDEENDDEQS